mmetsp:Transcript_15196/g.14591  ORF Transcript_15196/g.14591 Transcript_15196/m.14591 type:complete len:681 (+) Transcript_15196:218-2260(+)
MMIRQHFFLCLVYLSNIQIYGYKTRLFTFNLKSALCATTVERSIISESEEMSVLPELEKISNTVERSITSESENASLLPELEEIAKKTKVEKNAGLFRKITYSNKDFEFGEILTTDDVEEYQKRFQGLKELFPLIIETDLRSMVFISPLLLALETESLQTAVRRLSDELPYVDPSYLIKQRSCGLELLVAFMSPTFNLELRLNDVGAIIDDRNITEFVQRVPHSLTPRYLLALQEHCFVFNDILGFDLKQSLDIVEKWPGILGIDLKKHLIRFEISVKKLKLIPHNKKREEIKLISNLIKKVPRCLMQDMPRRVQILKQTFPHWKLPIIVRLYPRVLTQKMQGLVLRFETLQKLLDPYNIDANKLVNSCPRYIREKPSRLLEAANHVADVFPESSVGEICARAPRMISLSRRRLLPLIRRLRRAFLQGDSHDPTKYDYYNENVKSRKKSKSKDNFIQDFITTDEHGNTEIFTEKEKFSAISEAIVRKEEEFLILEVDNGSNEFRRQRNDKDLVDNETENQIQDLTDHETTRIQVAQILKRIGTTEATNLLATEYSDVDYENSIYYEDFSEDQDEDDREILMKILPLRLSSIAPPYVSDVNGIIEGRTVEEKYNNKEESQDETGDFNNLTPFNNISVCSDEISLTRIIMGNQDLFIDDFPQFLIKTGGWIKKRNRLMCIQY